jgi:hypothetical protein
MPLANRLDASERVVATAAGGLARRRHEAVGDPRHRGSDDHQAAIVRQPGHELGHGGDSPRVAEARAPEFVNFQPIHGPGIMHGGR